MTSGSGHRDSKGSIEVTTTQKKCTHDYKYGPDTVHKAKSAQSKCTAKCIMHNFNRKKSSLQSSMQGLKHAMSTDSVSAACRKPYSSS